jgi:hypothetical protein
MRLLFWFLLSLSILLTLSGPARAAGLPVDLVLVLAVDVSGSMDEHEMSQQRQGYIDAIRHPAVIRAILDGEQGRIALAYVEWAGAAFQWTLIDWTLIDGPESAEAFAGLLESKPLNRSMWTAIGSAIDYSVEMIERAPYDGKRRVIDISGDGPTNRGVPSSLARDRAVAKGITLNGLPILNDRPQPFGSPTPRQLQLDRYYESEVIGGDNAFLVVAEGFDDFRVAILQKLIREIAGLSGPVRTQLAVRPAVD